MSYLANLPLASFVHKSTVATGILGVENKLQPACATHWNSQVKLIRSAWQVPEEKLDSIDGAPTVGVYDANILKDFLEIF